MGLMGHRHCWHADGSIDYCCYCGIPSYLSEGDHWKSLGPEYVKRFNEEEQS